MRFERVCMVAAGLLCAIVSPVFADEIRATALVNTSERPDGQSASFQTFSDEERHSSPSNAWASATPGSQVAHIQPYAQGYAQWGGLLRARAVADGEYPGDIFYDSNARGTAVLREMVTIRSPKVPDGTPGRAVLGMRLHGSLSGQTGGFSDVSAMDGSGSVSLDIAIGDHYADLLYGGRYIANLTLQDPVSNRWWRQLDIDDEYFDSTEDENDSFTPFIVSINENVELEFSFIFGQEMPLELSLGTQSVAVGHRVGDSMLYTADAMNTAEWQGLTDVRLEDGTQVTDFSAIGQTSNSDYANPVPEPASLALLGLGGLAALLWQR